ncbi:MAG TPA: hypothetical protein VGQ83_41415 [Polyangia bacterium]
MTTEGIGRRLWAALLTGVPFGVFKIGGGLAALVDVHQVAGVAFIVWGALDVALNLAAIAWPGAVSYCALSNAGRRLDRRAARPGREQLLLALDTLLSFGIVASMIWTGRIATLPRPMVSVWESAVIANVLGVGVERVWRSWREQRAAQPPG